MLRIFILACLFLSAPEKTFAEIHESDVTLVEGIKFPNSSEEGEEGVLTTVRALKDPSRATGFTELLPYLLRSPDQEDAGSCLYMSLTGIAEWWLSRLNPKLTREPDGDLDLSERYLMNIAGLKEEENGISNWKTDSIYLFNSSNGAVLNRDFRYTKGWYLKNARGYYVASEEGANGAQYGTPFNWIDQRDQLAGAKKVELPRFRREVLFSDPESNQWNTGVMPPDIVERVKSALLENRAPVHLIYNHYGYWHATMIVGFDEEIDNNQCEFTREFLVYMEARAEDLRKRALEATNPKERDRLLSQSEKAQEAFLGAKDSLEAAGGCNPKGVFYVRDSLYGDEAGPKYDYDLGRSGDEAPYVKSTVLLEMDFVRHLGNHAVQVLVDDSLPK